MTEAIVAWSVAHRRLVVALTVILGLVAAVVGSQLDFDALPDLTNNQVLVLTRAPGLTPEEVERLVTRPVEMALGGAPRLIEQRSLSRYGISAVTAIFADEVPDYLARQIVQERLATVAANLPQGVEPPELGPLSGGLGEIFHFTLGSERRTPAELLELATLRVAPLLRSVPGVVEVNTWGGQQRTLEVRADPVRLAQRGLTLDDLRQGLEKAIGSAAGASVAAGSGQALLRGVSRPRDPAELAGALVPGSTERQGLPVRVGDVAEVAPGALPRIGAATANGRGETVYVMAQMLRGENALDVMDHIHGRLDEVRAALPRDVRLDVVYDRDTLVRRTLHTVFKNLLEGAALVIAVLFAMLGSLRAGLLVASAIPLSMLGAVAGMLVFGVSGNLMSLGAIDFGLLVDGAVVMIENIFHDFAHTEPEDAAESPVQRIGRLCRSVARPVFFSVLIILLVYVPVLSLTGADGKLFRPMALTVVFALTTALILSLTFIPAAASMLLRPRDVPLRPPFLVRLIERFYPPLLERVARAPLLVTVAALALLVLGGWLFLRAGSEFAPQLDEGDLVVQTTRASEISMETAVREAGRLERAVLQGVPEVVQVASRTGSPAVATDVMGIEQADVFITLKPRAEWRPGLEREALIEQIRQAIDRGSPRSDPSFTQPIQMRFNELLGGAVTDVAVSVYGEDLGELRTAAEALARLIEQQPGAVDVKVLAPPDVSLVEVRPRPLESSRAGFTSREVLDAVAAVRAGVEVGVTWDGPVRVPVVLRLANPPDAFTLGSLQLPTSQGTLVPLSSVADVERVMAPSVVQRKDAARRLVVGFNVRGADLGTIVHGAQAAAREELKLPPGYRLEWGGQYETLTEAKRRLSFVIPAVLLLIVIVLVAAFSRLRPAVIIFTHVPFACVGGVVALELRGLPISISAAIGFIALSGVAVLNGVVLMSRLLELQGGGAPPADAALRAAKARARPVLTTALVAALGFIPMMLATGAGAEVQRPLATVVVGGLVTSTLLTLVILPTLYPYLAGRRARASAEAVGG